MAEESIYQECNGIMPYTCHRTIHPNINFAGGDLFSAECLENFDGLLAFVHRGFIMDGTIKFPYVMYGAAGDGSKMPTIRKQERMIFDGLDELSSKGCRRIAFHGGGVTDATYVDGARGCIRAIAEWIYRHPDVIDNVTLVDLGDDYYIRFSHLLPWENGHINRYVRHGSEFELYFETKFQSDVTQHFDIYKGMADRKLNDSQEPFLENEKFYFSIGVFYMNLIPQAVAKLTGDEKTMHAFLKCAGWPEISCGLGGLMHSDILLHDNGLFPADDRVKEWKRTILNELEFFKAFTRDVIGGDIWQPQSQASYRLSRISKSFAEDCVNEIHRLVVDYIKCLDEGRPAPSYIVDEGEMINNTKSHKPVNGRISL